VPSAYGLANNASLVAEHRFGCGKCHPTNLVEHLNSTAAGSIGDPHPVQVNGHFDNTVNPEVGAAVFTPSGGGNTELGSNGQYWQYNDGSCADVYCHGEFAGGITTNDPVFQTGGTQPCGACHDVSGPPPSAGSHTEHAGNLAYPCWTCHEATVDGTPTVINMAVHVDGMATWDLRDGDSRVGASATYSGSNAGAKDPPSATYGQCDNLYCHSNANPVTGSSAPFDVYQTPTWGGALGGGCIDCHGNDPASGEQIGASASLKGSTAHDLHLTTYNLACHDCHSVTVQNRTSNTTLDSAQSTHVDGAKDIDFNSWPVNQTGGSWEGVGHTCTNTYCHSNGVNKSGPFTAPIDTADWDNLTTDCRSCHAGDATTAPTMATNGHASHVDQASYTGDAPMCAECHNLTVGAGSNTVVTDYTRHVNGVTDVQIAQGGAYAAGNCTNVYCHSNGTEDLTGDYVNPPTWTSGTPLANDCQQCHGTGSSVAGEPDYANNSASPDTRNSHATHVTDATDCVTCHSGTVDAAGALISSGSHLDGNRDVLADGTVVLAYTEATEACESACHNNIGSPVTWGASVSCRDCHMAAGAGDQDVDDYVWDDIFTDGIGTLATIDAEDWSAYGHGASAAYGESGNGGANFDAGGGDGCQYCHTTGVAHNDANVFRLVNIGGADGKVGVCLACHKTGDSGYDPDGGGPLAGRNSGLDVNAYHYGADHGGADAEGGRFCWDCHDPHGDYNYGASQPMAFMIQEQPVESHSGAGGWGVPTVLAATPDFRNDRDGTGGFGWGDYVVDTSYDGVCQVCHDTALHFTKSTYDTAHNMGARCIVCHSHDVPPGDAFGPGGGTCDSCHNAPPATAGAPVGGNVHASHTGAAVPTLYGEVNNSSVANEYRFGCGKCHPNNVTEHFNSAASGGSADPHVVQVAGHFDNTTDPEVGAAIFTPGGSNTELGPIGQYWRYSNGTCANTYCHGEFPGGDTGNDPAFQAGGTQPCGACHGVSAGTPPSGDSHPTHAGNLALTCVTCHQAVVDATPSVTDKALHVNGAADWDLDLSNPLLTGSATYRSSEAGAKNPPDGTYGQCSNVYCHSNGLPVDGPSVPYALYDSPTWGGAIAGNCTGCHGNNAASGALIGQSGVVKGSVGHVTHLSPYGFACDNCHAATIDTSASDTTLAPAQTTHINLSKDIDFGPWTANQTGATWEGTGHTCSDTYCHSDGVTAVPPFAAPLATPDWDGLTTTCTSCHDAAGASTTLLSGAHLTHTETDAYDIGCERCHGMTVSDSSTISGFTLHVNAVKDFSLRGAPNQANGTGTLGTTCDNLYCHSAGNDFTTAYVDAVSITWGSSTNCWSCHGTAGTGGAPDYADDSPKDNSHAAHTASSCDECHDTVVDGTPAVTDHSLHVNGSYDVNGAQFVVGSAGTDTTPTTCDNIACHGDNSATWGTSLGCRDCHQGTGAGDQDIDDYVYGNATTARIDGENWVSFGHGATAAYAESANAAANFDSGSRDGCAYCHDSAVVHDAAANPFRLANTGGGKVDNCLICHETGATGYDPGTGIVNASIKISATHAGADHGASGRGGTFCWDCHDPHGDYNYGATQRLAFMIQEEPVENHSGAGGWGVPTDLAATPDFRNNRDGTGGFAWGDYVVDSTFDGVCQVCHDTTLHFTKALYDGGHNTGNPCVFCHAHEQPPANAFGAVGGTCDACHNAPPTTPGAPVGGNVHLTHTGPAVPGTYGLVNNGSSGTAYRFACGKCHPNNVSEHLNSGAAGTSGDPHLVQVNGFFDATVDPENGAATYSAGGSNNTEVGSGGQYWQYSNGTCTNSYCHGEFPGGATGNDPAFQAGSQSCGDCHGASAGTPPSGGSHATHAGNLALTCDNCHQGTVDATPAVTETALHVNGAADWDLDRGNGQFGASATYDGGETGTSNPPDGTFGQCSTVYCHSNGNPIDGPSGPFNVNQSPTWGGAIAGACLGCHGSSSGQVIGQSGSLKGSTTHVEHVGTYSFACDDCHDTTMNSRASDTGLAGSNAHVDTVKDLDFTTWPANQTNGAYNGSRQCTNIYCHSQGKVTSGDYTAGANPPLVTPDWDNPTNSCQNCHDNAGAAATSLSGAHLTHTETDAYAIGCEGCHGQTVSNSTTVSDTSLHVNGVKDFYLRSAPNQTDGTGTVGSTCDNLYCHSAGNDFTAAYAGAVSIGWGSSTNCWSCHGTAGTGGAPSYADDSPKDNSHGAHSGSSCNECHNTVVNGTPAVTDHSLHVNGTYEISGAQFNVGSTGTDTVPSVCNNIACHGGGNATWGSTMVCLDCHTGTEGGALSDGSPNAVDDEWSSDGHGAAAGGSLSSALGGCDYCHQLDANHTPTAAANPYRLRFSATNNTLCLQCHLAGDSGINANSDGTGLTAENSSQNVDTAHFGAKHASGEGGELCWDCHDPHGVPSNILMVKSNVSLSSDTYGVPASTVTVSFTDNTTAGAGAGRLVQSAGSPRQGICQACHDPSKSTTQSTKYWRWDGTDDPDGQGGNAPAASSHNSGQLCTNCHLHTNNFTGAGGDCMTCHDGRTGAIPRAQIVGGSAGSEGDDFIRASRHVSDGTTGSIVTDFDCILCHAEGDVTSTTGDIKTIGSLHGGDGGDTDLNLRDVDAVNGNGVAAVWPGMRLGIEGTDWSANTADRDNMDSFCMGCHDSDTSSATTNRGGAWGVTVNGSDSGLTTGSGVARRLTPFNTNDTLQNAREPSSTNPTTSPTIRAWRVTNDAVNDVRGQFNYTNADGKAWASHHNLNQFTKRYTSRDTTAWRDPAWTTHTTKEGQNIRTAGETAGLHCSDCHLNEANAHGTRNTWYMMSNRDGNDTLFTNVGRNTSTGLCSKCHSATVYGVGNTDTTSSRVNSHNADGDRCDKTEAGDEHGFATLGWDGTQNGNDQLSCLGCHAGLRPGWIHGMNSSYQPEDGSFGTTQRYRFMGAGGSMRWYTPNLDSTITDADWEVAGEPGCYTINNRDTWGTCTQHDGGNDDGNGRRGRDLEY